MVKISEIKIGDIFNATYDGSVNTGDVLRVDHGHKQVLVGHGEQEFWYDPNDLEPVLLDESQLFHLKFEKHVNDDGSVKYSKGAFRIQIAKEGDFSNLEIWYRQEKRLIHEHINVHELQNHYQDMTKVHLTSEAF